MVPVWFISEDPAKKGGVAGGGGGGAAPLAFRDVKVKNNFLSQATITMTTPDATLEGDLMFAFVAIHSAISDLMLIPDDPTDGWARFDGTRENNAGQDHQYNVFWKLADGSDASGGASYQWNSRDSRDLIDRADEMDGYIAAFSGVQDPATDLDFLYVWESAETSGAGTDILLADIDFPAHIAVDGDGLLVCMVVTDSGGIDITSPAEMDEHLNSHNDSFLTMVLTSEDVSASTGSVGPKRFIQSSGIDYLGLAFILRPRTTGGRFESLYDYPKIVGIADRFLSVIENALLITATPPSGTLEDDLLILILSRNPSTASGTTVEDFDPAVQGWTTVYDFNIVNTTALGIWWKRATAEDASTAPDEVLMDWSVVGAQTATAIMYRISGISYDEDEQFIGFLASNAVGAGTPFVEPEYDTPFDDCLVFKIISSFNATAQRKDTAPRGAGKLVEHLTPSVSNVVGTMVLVEGAPFRGHYGGGNTLPNSSSNYDFSTFYITKNPAEFSLGDPFGVRGVRPNTFLFSAVQMVLYTPMDTREGDLLIVSIFSDNGATDYIVVPDDPLAGWERLDRQTQASSQYTLMWKIADGKDANGGGRHVFNQENSFGSGLVDQTIGMMAAFSGVQEPATDFDFLYEWGVDITQGNGTDALIADFDFSEAPEGDGLLVVFMVNEGADIIVPSEMTTHLNEGHVLLTHCLATELISPSTGPVGPKRFTNDPTKIWMAAAFVLKPFDTGGRGPEAIHNNFPKFLDIANRSYSVVNAAPLLTIQVPSGTEVGDLLLLCMSRTGNITEVGEKMGPDADPTDVGWTVLYDHLNGFLQSGIGVWWKIADAEDASTQPDEILIEWATGGGSKAAAAFIYRIGGVTLDTADSFIELLGSEENNGSLTLTDPIVTTTYDDAILIKVFGSNAGQVHRGDWGPNGFGKVVDDVFFRKGLAVAVKGAPFIGSYGGGTIQHRTSIDYEIATIAIYKTPQPPAEVSFAGHTIVNAGSSTDITLTTPSETLEGDLLVAFIAVHTATINFSVFPDDLTAGWTLLDHNRENLAGKDHQHSVFWKVADGSDVAGGATHQFNNRNQENEADLSDVTDGSMMAFRDVEPPATDVAFLYQWDEDEIGGTAEDALVADMPFREAPEGDGMLVCLFTNDNTAATITTPAEMDEHLNDTAGFNSMVIATETVSPSTGSVGPKRFIQSTSTDWLCSSFILKPFGGGRTGALYTYPKIIDPQGRRLVTFFGQQRVIVTPPSGTQIDDLLIMVLGRDGHSGGSSSATPDVNPTSQGWTELYSLNVFAAAAVWWKRATADDASTAPDEIVLDWSAQSGSFQDGSAMMFRVSGVTFDTADSFIGLLGSNVEASGAIATEPVVTTPYDNCLIFKVLVCDQGQFRRRDTEPRGAGNIVASYNQGSLFGATVTVMVEGAPFAGEYGGNTMANSEAVNNYQWIDIYIAKEAV